MSLTTEIKALLTTQSNIYIGSIPDSPNNVIGIYNTGGYPRSLSGTYLEERTFMVKVRNTSYATGETLCETINGLLHGKSSTKVLMIENQGGINDIGRDESGRPEFTQNYRCYYRR